MVGAMHNKGVRMQRRRKYPITGIHVPPKNRVNMRLSLLSDPVLDAPEHQKRLIMPGLGIGK